MAEFIIWSIYRIPTVLCGSLFDLKMFVRRFTVERVFQTLESIGVLDFGAVDQGGGQFSFARRSVVVVVKFIVVDF